ncbi:hypothetical protein N7G274_005558 [Stereocaulon virgatum]|uniref:Uncharacterized protein n=1 Tax=Stereocaulon virgatum TaxID=373712 RepID=A0ABR4A787_9LECA
MILCPVQGPNSIQLVFPQLIPLSELSRHPLTILHLNANISSFNHYPTASHLEPYHKHHFKTYVNQIRPTPYPPLTATMVGKVWDTADKLKLLLIIIEILDPKAPPRPRIAAAMGEGYTVESVKQAYQKGIKKGFKSSAATDTSKNANANSNDTPASTKTTKPTAKGRKRKAPTPAVVEDDDEEPAGLPPTKVSRKTKIKTEDTKNDDSRTLGAELFKSEEISRGPLILSMMISTMLRS